MNMVLNFLLCLYLCLCLQLSEELSVQLAALETEKAGLVETVSQKDVELAGLGVELERVQSSLGSARESGVKAAEALQNQLNEKVKTGYMLK